MNRTKLIQTVVTAIVISIALGTSVLYGNEPGYKAMDTHSGNFQKDKYIGGPAHRYNTFPHTLFERIKSAIFSLSNTNENYQPMTKPEKSKKWSSIDFGFGERKKKREVLSGLDTFVRPKVSNRIDIFNKRPSE